MPSLRVLNHALRAWRRNTRWRKHEPETPYLADLPQKAIPAHRTWFPDRMNFFVVGYNTAKVRRSEIPATYEGFTDPKWRGRIGLAAADGPGRERPDRRAPVSVRGGREVPRLEGQ